MIQKGPAVLLALLAASWAPEAPAYSLLTGGGLAGARAPLVGTPQPVMASAEVPVTAAAEVARGRAQSLFIDRDEGSFFAPHAPRVPVSAPPGLSAPRGGDVQAALLRQLIARAEAGPAGYDAVQHGARVRPARAPTAMTLGEIFAWIEATPGQPHAIGRYQFIPATLSRLAGMAGAGPGAAFSPELQDRLADILLAEAGLGAYRAGEITRHQFMNNLARIWAGLPNSSGRSHYDGYAGNAATMSWAAFDQAMVAIFES
ncbi:hypothetical protein [Pseudoroseicyclus sp. CXY001]|uniref:hypothetical protein n=1 Tax=Pseudoroseicyclus sp. CXY001 TaxID=3242492 RepID=UPI00357120DC